MFKRFFIILLFIFLISSNLYTANVNIIPKTILILPESSTTKIKWILAPEQANEPLQASSRSINFYIDYKNDPIFIYDKKIIFNPFKAYIARLKQTIKDIVSLDNGVVVFSDNINMGFLEIEKDSSGMPSASLKTLSTLPLPGAKLFKGDNTIYTIVFNQKTKKNEVYFFNNWRKNFQKISHFSEPINAISGKGESIYLAFGRLIKEYKKGNLALIYEHPREEIKELFYNERVGLIYKTSNGVGIVKNNSAFEFLQTENPVVFLKDTSLYVFFPSVSGMIEIINIDDLKNYNFKVEKIVDIKLSF